MKTGTQKLYDYAGKMTADFGANFISVKNGNEVVVGLPTKKPSAFRVKRGIRIVKPEIIITKPNIAPLLRKKAAIAARSAGGKTLEGGVSIGVEWRNGTSILSVAGTGGFIAQHPKFGKVLITNAHVVQNVRHWSKVTSPSRSDGGLFDVDGIGTVVHLSIYHDIAIIKLFEGVTGTNLLNGRQIGAIGKTGFKDRIYDKFGRTTGHTRLRESEYTHTNIMHPTLAGLKMINQDLFRSADNRRASDRGDSGSIIAFWNLVRRYWELVSHLWGGIVIDNQHFTIGDPIAKIFEDEDLYLLIQEMPQQDLQNMLNTLTVENLVVKNTMTVG